VNATPDYLDMFPCEYIEGSKENVLKNNGCVMSEEVAVKFFGKESAIGKTVIFGSTLSCNIQAVVRVPKNTHMTFGILDFGLVPYYGGVHYILIMENSRFSEATQVRMADFLGTTRKTENKLSFLSLKDVHLHSPEELANNTVW
jgi:putative ABC transport system permease protein